MLPKIPVNSLSSKGVGALYLHGHVLQALNEVRLMRRYLVLLATSDSNLLPQHDPPQHDSPQYETAHPTQFKMSHIIAGAAPSEKKVNGLLR